MTADVIANGCPAAALQHKYIVVSTPDRAIAVLREENATSCNTAISLFAHLPKLTECEPIENLAQNCFPVYAYGAFLSGIICPDSIYHNSAASTRNPDLLERNESSASPAHDLKRSSSFRAAHSRRHRLPCGRAAVAQHTNMVVSTPDRVLSPCCAKRMQPVVLPQFVCSLISQNSRNASR